MNHFADNLRFLRKSRKLSQEQLAEEVGLNRGNIASYEKGDAEPNMENTLKFVKYFNIDMSDMLEKDLTYEVALNRELSHGNGDLDFKMRSHFMKELTLNKKRLSKYINQSDGMQRILEGFRQFHKFQMDSGVISEDVKKMADDYEKLLDVMEALLRTNQELIGLLENEKSN